MMASACARHNPASDDALAEPAGPYRLGSGDRLRVIVFGQDNLSNIYAVDGAGRIAMPLIGGTATWWGPVVGRRRRGKGAAHGGLPPDHVLEQGAAGHSGRVDGEGAD